MVAVVVVEGKHIFDCSAIPDPHGAPQQRRRSAFAEMALLSRCVP
jgi:hypothetical protein